MKVYQAINAVQGQLAKTGIAKTRTNTQGSGFKFRGIDDVYNAIAPLLADHGLCILPRMLSRICEERTSKSGSALFYVTVEAEFDFVAVEDGSKHTVKTFGEAMDSGDKATNKAMSSAYKYACFQSFAIPLEGEPDSEADSFEVDRGMPTSILTDHLTAIFDATTIAELTKVYTDAYKAAGNDKNAQNRLIKAKDDMKAKLGVSA
jgi:hypothetical protein